MENNTPKKANNIPAKGAKNTTANNTIGIPIPDSEIFNQTNGKNTTEPSNPATPSWEEVWEIIKEKLGLKQFESKEAYLKNRAEWAAKTGDQRLSETFNLPIGNLQKNKIGAPVSQGNKNQSVIKQKSEVAELKNGNKSTQQTKSENKQGTSNNASNSPPSGGVSKDNGKNKGCPKCPVKKKPVNPIQGCKVLFADDELDFSLPATLPITWQRTYSSDNKDLGLLGQGWSIDSVDQYLLSEDDEITFVDTYGRRIQFGNANPGSSVWHGQEQITIRRGPSAEQLAETDPNEQEEDTSCDGLAVKLSDLLKRLPQPMAWNDKVATLDAGDGVFLVFAAPIRIPEFGVVRWSLTAIIDQLGAHTSYSWSKVQGNATPRLLSLTDCAGRVYGLHYIQAINPNYEDNGLRLAGVALLKNPSDMGNNRDLPTTIAEWQEIPAQSWLVRYSYDAAGQLNKVQDTLGNITRKFQYDAAKRITMHENAAGLISRYSYYDSGKDAGKVAEQQSNDGENLKFNYFDEYTEVIDQLGRKTLYHFDGEPGFLQNWLGTTHPDGSKEEMTYNPNGILTSQTDALGRTTRFSLDRKGRVVAVALPDGSSIKQKWHETLERVIEREEADGTIWKYQFDALGRQTAETNPKGETTHYRYDKLGDNPNLIKDAKGGVKYLQWDHYGNLASYKDCSGKETRWQFDNFGRPYREILANGDKTLFVNDRKGRLLRTVANDDSETAWAYDAAGQPLAQRSADESELFAHYNVVGQLTRSVNALGQVSRYTYDSAGRMTALINENQAQHRFEYDNRDRVIKEIAPDGRTLHYRYDAAGQLLEQSEGEGSGEIITRYQRDQLGRLLKLTTSRPNPKYRADAEENTPEAQKEIITGDQSYSYSKIGQLLTATNSEGTLTLSYDLVGNLIGEQFEPAETSPAAAWQIAHSYDELGNRLSTTLPEVLAGQAQQTLNYLYYGSGHLHQINLDGKIISDFERDDLHREITRSQGARRNQFSFDRAGRLSQSKSILGGSAKEPSVGVGGGVGGAGELSRKYHYDQVGNLTNVHDSNKGRSVYIYDAAGYIRLRGSFAPGTEFGKGQNPTERLKETFHFDPAGNIQEQVSTFIDSPATRRARDKTTKPSYSEWQQSAYKKHQKQASASPSTPEQNALKSNRLETYQDHRYRYDDYGRLIEKISGSSNNQTVISFTWDDNHQLIASSKTHNGNPKQSTTYSYDALGRRLSKTDTFASSQFIWSGDQMLGERRNSQSSTYVYEPNSFVPMARLDNLHQFSTESEDDAQNQPNANSFLPDYPYADRPDLYTQWREPGTGKILNLPVGKNDPKQIAAEAKRKEEFGEWGQAKVYHFHNDQIGTPHELTAHSGELAWQADYQVWGNTVICEWLQTEKQRIEQNLRFQGQYFDCETGLHYNRFRYYDPDCGRFVSHDPIGLAGGQNVYAYAVNPTGWVDPWGLKYQSIGRSSTVKSGKDKNGKNNISEWRRVICSSNLKKEREKFLGDDMVKVGDGKWRSLDGTRQFRVTPSDYSGAHGMGKPNVPNTSHVHFEFLSPTKDGNFKVTKNIHVPLKVGC